MNQTLTLAHGAPIDAIGAANDPVPRGLFEFLDEEHTELAQQVSIMRLLAQAMETDGVHSDTWRRFNLVLHWFNDTARQHHIEEEKAVFPAFLSCMDANVVATTQRMLEDHRVLERQVAQMLSMLAKLEGEPDGVNIHALCETVRSFEQNLLRHMVVEDVLIYPTARNHLSIQELESFAADLSQMRTLREAGLSTKSAE